jgi:hypothetical protein
MYICTVQFTRKCQIIIVINFCHLIEDDVDTDENNGEEEVLEVYLPAEESLTENDYNVKLGDEDEDSGSEDVDMDG